MGEFKSLVIEIAIGIFALLHVHVNSEAFIINWVEFLQFVQCPVSYRLWYNIQGYQLWMISSLDFEFLLLNLSSFYNLIISFRSTFLMEE